MKKVKWRWDWGCYVPLCPYCNELAYYKDFCHFCNKPYKWVDKSKDRKVTVGEYTVVQASNNHITICKGDERVMHLSCTKKLSKRKLKGYVKFYESFREERNTVTAESAISAVQKAAEEFKDAPPDAFLDLQIGKTMHL